ncbi:hypothetical protein [Verrucomicrobium spinosum]|nr:hypothetical protein [Verrucomicrobium spinosum]
MLEWVQLGFLAVPIAISAMFSPDQFSLHALENKGLYEGESNQTGRLRGSLPVFNGAGTVGGTSPDGRGDYIVIDEQNLRRSFKLSDLEATVPRSQEGDFQLSLAELYLIAGDPDMASVVDGQPVETLGRVIPEKGNTEGGRRLRLFRLEVMCCAADARPYSIAVGVGEPPPPLKSMAWVKVRGVIRYLPSKGRWLPRLHARSIQPTTAPLENPF